MRRISIILTTIVAVIIFNSCSQGGSNVNEEVAIPVSVEEITRKPIEQFIETSGTVYSTKEAALKSEMAGKYTLQINPKTNRPFKLGDLVDKGVTIATFEDREYEIGISLETKELSLDISKRTYEQQQSLYEKGGVTEKDVTDAKRSYIDAKNSYETAMLSINKMKVVAPFTGVIVELPYYTPGIKINSGASVAKMMDYSKLYFEISLPEKEMSNVKVDQSVRVFNYSYPADTFMANISQLSPVINPDTRSFKGIILVDNPKLKLRPGMFIKAEIVTERNDTAIVVPRDLILSDNRGLVVYVVDRNTARRRRIQTGIENPKEVEVISGLEVDERLVIEGFETLRDRSKVKVVK